MVCLANAITFQSSYFSEKKSVVCGGEEMATIGEVNLTERHEMQWKFSDGSRTLAGGRIVLKVKHRSQRWDFECKSVGGGVFCISGSAWGSFVRQNMDAMLTLYAKEDGEDFHRIRLRLQHSSFVAALLRLFSFVMFEFINGMLSFIQLPVPWGVEQRQNTQTAEPVSSY
ncbi:hypothetical protein V6N13_080680 [Hibiscus sabdariffa]